jgi:hypothetical protein
MTRANSTVIALLVAPLVPAVWTAILTLTSTAAGLWPSLVMGGMIYVIAMVPTVVIALPLFLFLSRHNYAYWWSGVVSGVVIGAFVGIGIRWPATLDIRELFRTGLMGGLAGGLFWSVWRLGEPRDENSR